METIYIEFMEELKILLEVVEKSWLNEWIQKSIDKYKNSQDVSYYLTAFGGMGSFNDEVITSETTEILKTITYYMSKEIQNQGTFNLYDILQKVQINISEMIESTRKISNYLNKEKDIEWYTNLLNYINYLIENYSVGNLHQLTNNYLAQKDISNNRIK